MAIVLTGFSVSNRTVSDGLAFEIEGGVIKSVREADAFAGREDCIDLRRFTVLPGLIDIHVHGGNGFDTMDGTRAAIDGLSRHKVLEGVTSFMPATVTASAAMTDAAIDGVNAAMAQGTDGAKALGVFLEGPYINPKNKGAHPLGHIRPICLPDMKELVSKVKKGVVSLAVAPELPGATEAIRDLTAMGVNVRMGHSSATWEEARAGAEAGANAAIHTYNAMSAFTHREPGLTGAAMTLEGLYAEIICDLVHVSPIAVSVLVKARGADNVVLVTDCMSAGGLADGDYKLGELPVRVKGGICRLADGTLAGSTARLLDCVRNMHQTIGVPLADAAAMATANPAKTLGLYDRIGSLEAGKQADMIAVDEDFNLRFVMIDGRVVRPAAD